MRRGRHARGRRSRAQAIGLLLLSPLCAEYVAAYDRTTGDPAALLAGLVFFVPLYGCAALLVREAARRAGLGWRGILLLALAFGLVEAGMVDQSLFSTSYREIPSWEDTRLPTLIHPLGVSAYDTLIFLYGHVVWSIGAPIAIVEAFRPERRYEPWVGQGGLGLATLLYVAASLLVLVDHLQHETSHASAPQLVACGLIAAAMVALAVALRDRSSREPRDVGVPRPRVVFGVTLTAAVGFELVPATWLGVGLAALLALAAIATILRLSRSPAWGLRHQVAVAGGALIANALLAFLTTPLLGHVSDGRRYAHNTAFLLGLLIVLARARRL